jgi:hypothetical protein
MIGTSCNDYLDINEDPNKATVAPPGPIFTGVITQYSTNRVIDLGPALSTGAQFWSGGGTLGAGVFTRPEQYNFSIFTIGNTWRAYYREIQKNLALAIIGTQEAGDLNAEAQCKIFQAFTYYSTTVLWGDVPFSEAIAVDFSIPEIKNINPKFDPQQEVLEGVLNILDEAISLIDESGTTSITNSDLIYTGDMSKWSKFAKSLKFRTLLTMVDADPSKAEAISRMMSEGGMIEKGDNAEFPFFAVSGNQNPFWGTLNTFAGGTNFFYFAGDEMVKLMQELNDPRLTTYFEPYPGGGSAEEVTGAPAGAQSFPTNPWVLTTSSGGDVSLVRPDAPDVLFSYSEQAFLEAEAMVRGFGSGGKQEADSKLREGIRDAMEQYNIDNVTIENYLNDAIPDLVTLSDEEARAVIAEQIWIDCIIRPLEGFTHWRRAEIPALPVPEGAALTNFLRRLTYPPDEISANNSVPEVLPNADEKLWFDQ